MVVMGDGCWEQSSDAGVIVPVTKNGQGFASIHWGNETQGEYIYIFIYLFIFIDMYLYIIVKFSYVAYTLLLILINIIINFISLLPLIQR